MMKRTATPLSGFSLVEVALALGVASFCMITLLALIPVGVTHYQQADAQSTMVNLATMVTRDLQSTSSTMTASPRFGFSIPASGGTSGAYETVFVDASGTPSGTGYNAAIAPTSTYRVTLLFYPPASTTSHMGTLARIWVTFPAHADSTPTQAPANYSNMFETTVTLNRN